MGGGREELKEHSTRHRVLNQEPGTKASLRSLTIYPQTLSLEYAINMTLTPNLSLSSKYPNPEIKSYWLNLGHMSVSGLINSWQGHQVLAEPACVYCRGFSGKASL